MRRLHAAGAGQPAPAPSAGEGLSDLAGSIGKLTPMLAVPDLNATVAWYQAVGFELAGSHDEGGKLDWASVRLGDAEIMFVPAGEPRREQTCGVSLWIAMTRIDALYALFKERQLERARAELAGQPAREPAVRLTADLYAAFYGQREFGIRDPNGVELMFAQPVRQHA